MRLERLSLARFRSFEAVEWYPGSGINLVVGDNGAGKTTLLEAVHLLANGRSFRGRVRDGLIRHGQDDLEVFAEWRERSGRLRCAGLRHSGREWEARLDARPAGSLAELCSALAVLTVEPGTHSLIAGGSEQRRQFIDWGLFHVEPEFLPVWRRYARALKQRNALLKSRPDPTSLQPWDCELVDAGEPLTRWRALHLKKLEPLLVRIAARYLSELGMLKLEFLPGWRRDEYALAEALERSRDRDLLLGHSTTGPHRADWRIGFEMLPGRSALSRGQEKLVALCCILAQGHAYAAACLEWPVIALDDLASELDRVHQERVIGDLVACEAQILLTSTEPLPALARMGADVVRFHVEQGQVRALI
ncbi:MAG TPA: DNA replication/repair protein RecF [Xanthomonadaceae bacterium]|jgi:DNA replication and repair protein RecF